jgi:hypothetical protein
MNKAISLRQMLTENVSQLKKHPDKLKIFIETGNIVARLTSLSFEYRYQLNVLVVDYEGHPDDIVLPMLRWVAVNQPDLMQNPEKAENQIVFEAEPINNETYDIKIQLPLVEAVKIEKVGNTYQMTHLEEPELNDLTGPSPWELYANNDLIG